MRTLLATLLVVGAAAAQTNRGSISGTVFDRSQAVIAGANVTITSTGTHEVRKVTTSESGAFSAQNLEPVTYNIEVQAPGFKKKVIENFKLDTASNATLNVTMEAGAVETQVTVSADAAMVNTESGTTSSTVTEREIQDVPLVNRSVLDLALTLPNVSGDAGSENPGITAGTACPGCNLVVGGGRPLSTQMLADGANNTGVSLARTMVSFSPETVQEFTVQTTAYSAEYGNTGGGIINATTKSGTNELHGTALWYNRNPKFAAAPWTNATTNRPVPTLKYNQFSIAAGGPVWIPKVYNGKNKTFWFAAYEPFYRRDHLDQYGLLPTEGMLHGDFSDVVNTSSGWIPKSVAAQFASIAPSAVTPLDSTIYQNYNLVNGNQFTPITAPTGSTNQPFPGNRIPQNMLDPSALKAESLIAPAGDYFLNSNGLISNALLPRRLRQDEKRYTVRIDQNFGDTNRLYGRYTSTPIIKTQDTPLSPTSNGAEYSWARQALIADTHTFSPTLINELRLNYTRGRFSSTVAPEYDPATGQNINTLLGLPSITSGGVPGLNALFPGSSFGGGGSTATGIGGGASTQNEDREERYGITDIVSKVHGSMSLRMGTDLSHSLQNVIPLFAALGGQYGFSATQTNSTGTTSGTGGSPWASFLLGVPNGNVTLRNVEIPYYYRWNAAALFIQDDWKVRPNLTLNLGLR
ncbi:MAG TPA: carboxypeptidase-like regulatory domain-containing protein, partial [Bryobacteraceae bacterium]